MEKLEVEGEEGMSAGDMVEVDVDVGRALLDDATRKGGAKECSWLELSKQQTGSRDRGGAAPCAGSDLKTDSRSIRSRQV